MIRKLTISALVVLIACVGINIVINHTAITVQQCEALQDLPEIPLHMSSVTIESNNVERHEYNLALSLLGMRNNLQFASKEYMVNASVSEITEFYNQYGVCSVNDEQTNVLCTGEATPSGEFSVYFPKATNDSSLEVVAEYRWHGCSNSLSDE